MNKNSVIMLIFTVAFPLFLTACGGAGESNKLPTNTTTSSTAPVLNSIGNKSVIAGNNINFTVSASDPNNKALTYTTDGTVGTGNPYTGTNPATFNLSSNQIFNWTPTSAEIGNYDVEFIVENSDGEFDSEQIRISVTSASGGDSITVGQGLFTTYCSSCHRLGGSAFVLGPASESEISAAIARNDGGMGTYSFLTTIQRQSISDYLVSISN